MGNFVLMRILRDQKEVLNYKMLKVDEVSMVQNFEEVFPVINVDIN